MSAISFGPRIQLGSSARVGGAPVLRGLRSGCRAFAGEVAASVPVLQRKERADATSTRSRESGSVHLTRRGRLLFIGLPVMLATVAVTVALLVIVAPATVTASTEPAEGNGTEIVTVDPGQSMWEIAGSVDSSRDTRAVISEIMELNDLESQSVTTGQQLLVPAN